MQDQTVSLGIVGLGGFARSVLSAVGRLETGEPPLLRLAAVCEPVQEPHVELIAELRARGVLVVRDLSELLKLPVQAVWLPVPIHLHRPFTETAVVAGKWVICEKPAAGVVQDVDAMIAARDRHDGRVAIGFQDIHEAATPAIKRRLLAGEIGRLESATVTCCWPRPASYFARNGWAGRLRTGETWVLDSPCNNAMAHFLNLPLFLLGRETAMPAEPVRVEAELYRARPMESADTCCIRIETAGGARLLCLMTHACERETGPTIVIRGQTGQLCITRDAAEFRYANGATDRIARTVDHARSAEVAIRKWTGNDPDAVVASLEAARAQVLVVNGAFDAAPIRTIEAKHVKVVGDGPDAQPVLAGIESVFEQCAARGALVSELGIAEWAQSGGTVDLQGYRAFVGRFAP